VSGALDTLQPFQALSAWAPSGDYVLTGADIADYVGNLTTYGQADVQKIFRRTIFHVDNANADHAFPEVISGVITTPTISLSSERPVFQANLTVLDEISGIGEALVTLQSANGRFTGFGEGLATTPVKGKPVTLSIGAGFFNQSYLTPGSWSTTELIVFNNAGTKLDITDAGKLASIFGTTTFQLTK